MLERRRAQRTTKSSGHSMHTVDSSAPTVQNDSAKYIALGFLFFSLSTSVILLVLLDVGGNYAGQSMQPIPTVDWSTTTLQELTEAGVPVVLENTPFDEWPCMNWTWQYLRNRLKVELPVKVSRHQVFKYSTPDKPFVGATPWDQLLEYTNVIMAGRTLIDRLQDSKQTDYFYASGEAKLLGLASDFGDSQAVMFPAATEEDVQVNFWLGSRGVIADWHYDTSDNLHALIFGRKTFTLRPPTDVAQLGLYPSIHRYYRQTQVQPTGMSRLTGPFYEATLNPGQALYIPPYWFHTVHTETATASVNAWSHSQPFMTMENVYQLPIPLESHWPRCKLLFGSFIFVDELTRQLLPALTDRQRFLSQTVRSRYRIFEDAVDGNPQTHDLQLCARLVKSGELFSAEELETFISAVTGRVSGHVELFSTMHLPVCRINLANFIEHLYANVLGDDEIQLVPVLLSLDWGQSTRG